MDTMTRINRRWRRGVMLSAGVAAILANAPGASALAQATRLQSIEERLLDRLSTAAREKVALRAQSAVSSLRVANSAVGHYPLLGLSTYAYKIIDESGEQHRIMLDGNGDELDPVQMTSDELMAHEDRFGTLEADLGDRLATLAADDSLPVIIWAKEAASFSPERPEAERPMTAAQVQEILDRNDDLR